MGTLTSSLQESHEPRVTIAQGTLVGTILRDDLPEPIEAFLGVPYAIPPVGDLRFRPALPVGKSSSIVDATRYGNMSPAKPLPKYKLPDIEYAEDCLNLNVFRKVTAAKKPLPVFVYIHGGGFNQGTAAMHNTPSMLAHSTEPFIGVSFNYRLGALGFLPSALTAKEGALNLGLYDQVLLLQWVHDNIAAFGGDPGNVSIGGLSAGAHSVGHHLNNFKDGVPPLFHKAILESGASTSRAVRPYDAPIHEMQFRDFLREVGCPSTLADEDVFPFLRKLPSSVIADAQIRVFEQYGPSLRWAFQPVIDGDVIPQAPLESWKRGRWHKMPILTGFNGNEGSMYVDHAMDAPAAFVDFFRVLLPLLVEEDLQTLDALYPDPSSVPDSIYHETRPGVGSQYKRIEAAYGQYAYVAPVRQTAELASGATAEYATRGEKLPPVFLYHWALIKTLEYGAEHADQMPYETCNPEVLAVSPAQKELALTFHAYLTSFITQGDPSAAAGSCPGRPAWTAYHPSAPKALLFAEGNEELIGGGVGIPAQLVDDDWARPESRFWWSKVQVSQQ